MSLSRVKVILPDGEFGDERIFTLPTDEAVVAAHQQDAGNWNTWEYPLPRDVGVRPSSVRDDVSILDAGERFYAAFPVQS